MLREQLAQPVNGARVMRLYAAFRALIATAVCATSSPSKLRSVNASRCRAGNVSSACSSACIASAAFTRSSGSSPRGAGASAIGSCSSSEAVPPKIPRAGTAGGECGHRGARRLRQALLSDGDLSAGRESHRPLDRLPDGGSLPARTGSRRRRRRRRGRGLHRQGRGGRRHAPPGPPRSAAPVGDRSGPAGSPRTRRTSHGAGDAAVAGRPRERRHPDGDRRPWHCPVPATPAERRFHRGVCPSCSVSVPPGRAGSPGGRR